MEATPIHTINNLLSWIFFSVFLRIFFFFWSCLYFPAKGTCANPLELPSVCILRLPGYVIECLCMHWVECDCHVLLLYDPETVLTTVTCVPVKNLVTFTMIDLCSDVLTVFTCVKGP